jgi:hypothetical protein
MPQTTKPCSHLDQLHDVAPQSQGCEECQREGKHWVAIRKCLVCGHVGCCDSTPGRHARAHFTQTGHPLIEPMAGKPWTWCYVDDAYVQR